MMEEFWGILRGLLVFPAAALFVFCHLLLLVGVLDWSTPGVPDWSRKAWFWCGLACVASYFVAALAIAGAAAK